MKREIKAVFLDRDGTIIVENGYITSVKDIKLIPNIGYFLRKLEDLGYVLIIISNQSAIGRCLVDEKIVKSINDTILTKLNEFNCNIKGVYYCPHAPSDNCNCRKPKPGLLFKAAQELNIILTRSWMVGNKESDIIAGERAGCQTIKINSNSSFEEAYNTIKEHNSHD